MEEKTVQAIALSPLFSGTAAERLPWELYTCPDGQRVADCAGGIPQVGLVAEGLVAVYATAPDGREVRISSLDPGECFGIANLFSDEPLMTVLRCEGVCRIAWLPKAELIRLLGEDGEFALRYARLCSEKLQFLLRRVELLTAQNHRARVIAWLLSQPADDIRFPGHREELAAHLGMSRAALFRELAQLEGAELITTRGALIRVLNRPGLEECLYVPERTPEKPIT